MYQTEAEDFRKSIIHHTKQITKNYVFIWNGKIITNMASIRKELDSLDKTPSAVEKFLNSYGFKIDIKFVDFEHGLFFWGEKKKKYLKTANQVIDIFYMKDEKRKMVEKTDELILNTFSEFYNAFTVNIGDEYLFSYLLGTIIKMIKAEVGLLKIFHDSETQEFSMGFKPDAVNYIKYAGKPILDYLIESKEILLIADVDKSSDLELKKEYSGFIKSLLFTPIFNKGEIIAVIFLANKSFSSPTPCFTDQDFRFISTLSIQIGSIIGNALLYKKTIELKEFNEDVLENIPAGILTASLEGNILFKNRYMRDLCSKIAMDITGLLEFIAEQNDAQVFNLETRVPGINNVIYLNVAKRFLHLGNKPSFYLYTITDITQEKEIEKQLRKTEKLAVTGELISGIAHEIKNPLTSIKGFADLLPQRIDDMEFVNKFASITSNEINRLNNIIERFLSFARPEIGVMSEVTLNNVISEVIEIVSFHINQNTITLINNLDGNLKVFGNSELLIQVFINIILNSIQALVETDKPEKIIEIFGKKMDEGRIEVVIRDSGPGIKTQDLENIFNPFFTTKPRGSGLGLCITYKIMNEHKGTITADSKVNEYTKIILNFPALENTKAGKK
jgi:signal transduction histidine kinase